MSEEYYRDTVTACLSAVKAKDYLTESVRKEFGICEYNSDFFRKIHNPLTPDDISATQRRLIFDDLFYFASRLFREERQTDESDFIIEKTEVMQRVIAELPYKLTDDQLNTVLKIVENGKKGKRINALVQGDVGCGKTIVSFLSMIAFAENGYQCALMAPTQVLAKQHYEGLNNAYIVTNRSAKIAYIMLIFIASITPLPRRFPRFRLRQVW